MPRGAIYLTLEELLGTLDVPHLQSTNDLGQILRQSKVFDSAAKMHAAALLQTEQCRRWLSVYASELLHVDGHLDASRFGKTSPISHMCAVLVEVLQGPGKNITLHFFCGQHVASNDDLRGPAGLIRSLLTQLTLAVLQRWPQAKADWISLGGVSGHSQTIRVGDLCHAFLQLLEKIPDHLTVYCVIDGISWFERDEWAEEYFGVVGMLRTGASDETRGPSFKLLMTSPTRSGREMRESLRPHQHVALSGGRVALGPASDRALRNGVQEAVWGQGW